MNKLNSIVLDLEEKGFTFNQSPDNNTQQKEAGVPFIVKVLSVFGGITTMCFVLVLLALLNFHKHDTLTIAFGLGFVVGGILMSRHKLSLLFNSFGITMYLSGVALTLFGMDGHHISDEVMFCVVFVIGAISWIFSGSYLMKTLAFISTGLALVASNYTDVKIPLQFLLVVYLILFSCAIFLEGHLLSSEWKFNRLFYSLRSGSLFLLLFLLVCLSLNIEDFNVSSKWFSSIPFVIILFYLTHKLSLKLQLKSPVYAYIITGLICTSVFMAPSLIGGLTLVLATFYVNYKTGFYLGLVSIIYFVSRYYYDLNLTLLEKSGVMFGTGLILVFIYLIIRKQLNYEK